MLTATFPKIGQANYKSNKVVLLSAPSVLRNKVKIDSQAVNVIVLKRLIARCMYVNTELFPKLCNLCKMHSCLII